MAKIIAALNTKGSFHLLLESGSWFFRLSEMIFNEGTVSLANLSISSSSN